MAPKDYGRCGSAGSERSTRRSLSTVLSRKASEAGVGIADRADTARADRWPRLRRIRRKAQNVGPVGHGETIDSAGLCRSARTTLGDLDTAAGDLSASLDTADALSPTYVMADFSGDMGSVLDGLSTNTSDALADLSTDAGSSTVPCKGAWAGLMVCSSRNARSTRRLL